MYLTTIIDAIQKQVDVKGSYTAQAYTLKAAVENQLDGVTVTIVKTLFAPATITINNYPGVGNISVEPSAIWGKAAAIDNIAFAKGTYGKVTDLILFHVLYDVSDRQFNFKRNKTIQQETLKSAPCMECGLILPLKCLTIDHQRPQSGGDYEAVAKTFRAFSLTVGGPQGPKGQAILQHITQGQAFASIGTRSTRPALTSADNLQSRYTLNYEGIVIYSLIKQYGQLSSLLSACMHGLCNLRPMCPSCNFARGNPLKL